MIYSKKRFCCLICAFVLCIFACFGGNSAYASEVTYYKTGNKVKVSYKGEYENASFIIARYNADRSLAGCSVNKITFRDGQYTSSTITLNSQYKYKIMLWDFQQVKPLSKYLELDTNAPDTSTTDDGYTNRY